MSGPTTRNRKELLRGPEIGLYDITYNGDPISHAEYGPYEFWETQETTSEGHPRPYRIASGDRGGEFYTQRRSMWSSHEEGFDISQGSSILRTYKGPQYAHWTTLPNMDTWPQGSSTTVLDAKGTSAIARCEPTNPGTAGLTALLELYKDGIPKISGIMLAKSGGSFKEISRSLGGEYLNVEFGWKPLWSDFVATLEVFREADKLLVQLERDSGKPIRRRYSFPDVLADSREVLGYGIPKPALDTYLYEPGHVPGASTEKFHLTNTKTECWFSGAFTYHLQMGKKFHQRAERVVEELNFLYGIRPSLEMMWNLTPWSWAIDWFVGVQDYLHNLQAFTADGLVLRYGYLMETVTHEESYEIPQVRYRNKSPVNLLQKASVVTKHRRRASPFGFGLTFEEFTPRQWAITAALGLTRQSR